MLPCQWSLKRGPIFNGFVQILIIHLPSVTLWRISMDSITFRFNVLIWQESESINGEENNDEGIFDGATELPRRTVIDALMGRKRAFVEEKSGTNLNRKDELFNDLARWFKTTGVGFPSYTVSSGDGSYCLQVLTNALWYITNDHLTMNEACQHAKGPIPIIFRHTQFACTGSLFSVIKTVRKSVSWMEENVEWNQRPSKLS